MEVLTKEEISELRSLEQELWQEKTRFDIQRMREIMAEDFFEFGMSGRYYTLEDTLAIEAQEIKAEIPLANFSVRKFSENVALVTYNSATKYGEKVFHARRSSLWSRNNGGWQLRFHQGTPYEPGS